MLLLLGYELWNYILGKLVAWFHSFYNREKKRQLELWKEAGREFCVEIY